MEELEGIVKRMPEEKAPGLDGATIEILTKCWRFRKQDCLDKLTSNWSDGLLPICDSRGVIKLLSKSGEHQRIWKWRPITLLTLTYKLINKTLAIEYALATNQETLMLKLDFEKAYDRVSHGYLEAVLRKLKFSTLFINLALGLLRFGTSKVHTNGLFTNEFELNKGVRQGCPIAPSLFTLCTEPLMAMLLRLCRTSPFGCGRTEATDDR
ncbi:hypothetical protein R1sor_020471 [Riccia sorocarpa]|uniref:Reverse transcriptase domain-containing protein n=1 Tax=Riccia sorocarpa TaxID=122646 RepID=A0ABD3IIT5_9MARC